MGASMNILDTLIQPLPILVFAVVMFFVFLTMGKMSKKR
jgi:hypothetical protein